MSTQPGSPLLAARSQSQLSTNTPELEGEDQAQAAIIRRIVEVVGDRSEAMRWLGTLVRALSYANPISLLHDSQGRDEVLFVLGRLEHGGL